VFVTNWDKRESESFGLLKVDILGLTTLSVLNHARNLIFERHGKTIEFTKIPLDDQDTIELFQNAETAGIFQFEGGGMKSLLKNIKPATFREITDCTALYRPGSLQSGQTQQYVDIARGEAGAMYKTEMLKPILQETNGQLVYQEQIMQIFNQLGNFTWAESDKMRKIIGKKLGKDEFNKHKEHFVSGCAENGIKEMVAVQLFDDMAEFASYSFNLSHAVSYTLISFWAAYLKVHYPVEFFAASLSHAGDDNIEILINDMRRFDIQIDIPDINVSGQYYQIDGAGNIRYPLSAIKGVGVKAVETILEGRKGGPFDNLEDFQGRINKRACNKRVVEKLIEAGALESIGFKEIDPAKRSKNFIELIAGYSELPKIKLENRKIDTKGVVNFIEECENCAKEKGRGEDFIFPHIAKPLHPNIMVINNKTKRQNHLLSGKVGQYLLDRLKKSGVEKGDVYVTGAMKCQTTFKECEINSYEAIKQEIKLVKPALIICFVGDLVTMFEPKGKMAKLHGQIKYNSEFDTYVLFSYSPQYAFFQPDKAKELFESAMDKVALVIEGR
jgi:DNA polymerase-3 subunit alpha